MGRSWPRTTHMANVPVAGSTLPGPCPNAEEFHGSLVKVVPVAVSMSPDADAADGRPCAHATATDPPPAPTATG